jgi:sugar/nucleoside kinase (ribokinase family)
VPVNAVDPTGAGNAYGGGQIVGWDRTRDGLHAGCYGAVSASFAVEVVGIPTLSPALEQEARNRLARALEEARPL